MSEGLGRLAATLAVDKDRLGPLQGYDDARLLRLEELIRQALSAEDQAFADGLEAALRLVPRPLRGTARKMLSHGGDA